MTEDADTREPDSEPTDPDADSSPFTELPLEEGEKGWDPFGVERRSDDD